MSEAAMKLLEQIRALSVEDQDWLAEQLDDRTDDPEFFAELERRSDEAHKHPERLIDGPTAMAEARKYVEALRNPS
jgi:hypothetical protein